LDFTNSTQGDDLDQFLQDEELKDTIEVTIAEALGQLLEISGNDNDTAQFVNITTRGIDSFFNASSAEEANNATVVDGLTTLGGDTAEVIVTSIADLIEQSIANSTAAAAESNAGTMPPSGNGNSLPGLEPLEPLDPVTQEEWDAFAAIFEEGFKNMGTFRKGSRSSQRRLRV